jgi:hypothetical protein
MLQDDRSVNIEWKMLYIELRKENIIKEKSRKHRMRKPRN